MSKVVKVVELLSQSSTSWEDAAQGAVDEAPRRCEQSFALYQGVYRRSG